MPDHLAGHNTRFEHYAKKFPQVPGESFRDWRIRVHKRIVIEEATKVKDPRVRIPIIALIEYIDYLLERENH